MTGLIHGGVVRDERGTARDARDVNEAGAAQALASKWVPVIHADTCTGCNLCIEACGPKCLELVDELAVLTLPDNCGSEEHCIPVCEFDAIRMDWVEMDGDRGRGKWRDAPR